MLNICVCSNDSSKINSLEKFINKYFNETNKYDFKLHTCNTLQDVTFNKYDSLDILFIEVDLNDKSIVSDINSKVNLLFKYTQVVFVTDIVDFMLNGFCLKDFRYVFFPLKYPSFEEELSSCIECINSYSNTKTISNIDSKMKNTSHKFNMDYNKNTLIKDISVGSICYIKSISNTSIAYTSKKSIELDCSVDNLEQQLRELLFFRCHDNYLVNLNKISKLNKSSVIINNESIPVSKDKFTDLKNMLLAILKIV